MTQTNVDVILKFTPEKAFDGRRLINYIHIFKVMSMDFWDSMCFVEPDCVSINLDKQRRKTKKKDHYFYHLAEIGVASLANTHFKRKKVSEIFIKICR